MANTEIQSPCIGVCSIDDSTGFCQGCYRTMDEIQGWGDLTEAQKNEITQIASQREEQAFD